MVQQKKKLNELLIALPLPLEKIFNLLFLGRLLA
jgi:hypothetical protein